jgi:broad specificity phosphatase PhoE
MSSQENVMSSQENVFMGGWLSSSAHVRAWLFRYRFHHGESGGDVWDRVSDWWASAFREFSRHRYDNYVIVTHGLTMRCIFMVRAYALCIFLLSRDAIWDG